MAKEIENLPDISEKLEPRERADLLMKLMPIVVPKVQSISHSLGEPP